MSWFGDGVMVIQDSAGKPTAVHSEWLVVAEESPFQSIQPPSTTYCLWAYSGAKACGYTAKSDIPYPPGALHLVMKTCSEFPGTDNNNAVCQGLTKNYVGGGKLGTSGGPLSHRGKGGCWEETTCQQIDDYQL